MPIRLRYIFSVDAVDKATGREHTVRVESDTARNASFRLSDAGLISGAATLAEILEEHTGPDDDAAPIPPIHAGRDTPVSELTRDQLISAVSSAIVWGWLKILAFAAIVGLVLGLAWGAMRV